MSHRMALTAPIDGLMAGYRDADPVDLRLVEAALACIARWGVAKTSLDDIARQAGVSRATVYRAFPGGKDRLLEQVLDHELGRFFHDVDAELAAAGDLAELLTRGITRALAEIAGHPALRTLVAHEPHLILPHFSFHRLGRFLAATTELCRPHLARHLPDDAVAPAAEWAARIVLTYSVNPTPLVDPAGPASVRHLVDTYLSPALARFQESR